MKYQLTGSVSLSKNTKPRSTRAELLRVDEDTGKPYKDYAHHIDTERTKWNRVLVNRNVREVYMEHIGPCIEAYNEQQTAKGHPERCKSVDSYMADIIAGEKAKNASKRPRLWNDILIQCGDRLSNEAWQVDKANKVQPELARISNKVYEEFVEEFQKKFPNLVITASSTHNDEGCSHNMIQYVAFCRNNKRGLAVQVKLMDALAEALDAIGVSYNRKQNDGVKHAFNKVLDDMLTNIMARHGIERVPGKERYGFEDISVAELRKRSRLLQKELRDIIDKGDDPLDALEKRFLPVIGSYYLERDVKAMVNEWKKERALLEARTITEEEIGRRTEMLIGEHKKKIEVGYASREAELARREEELRKKDLESDRALRDVLILKEKLQDRDQQHRYEMMADELASKQADIDHAHSMRAELYLETNKKAEEIISQARAEADRIITEAKTVTPIKKEKLRLLAERYPGIDKELDKAVTVKGAGRKKMPLRPLRNREREKSKRT